LAEKEEKRMEFLNQKDFTENYKEKKELEN